MEKELNVTKFEVVAGKKGNSDLLYSFAVGQAFYQEGSGFYELEFWSTPRTLYIVRNHGKDFLYTIFAKKVEDGNGTARFQNPVGYAFISDEFKNYMEIRIRWPRGTAFMSLFPSG